MKICVISSCGTKQSDKERSLFEIKGEDRQKWIPVIQAFQELDVSKLIFICDLHFHRNDLIENGKCLRPKKNILPHLIENSTFRNGESNILVDECDEDCTASASIHSDPISTITIPLQEYRKLCQSTIDLIKANQTIEKLTKKLEKTQKTNASHISPDQNEVLDTLMNRPNRSTARYSPALRKFCWRVQFHSSAAYNELRKFFSNRLPARRTLQRWLRCVDSSPGITETAINAISEKVHEQEGKLYLCLMSDDVAIKKQVIWNAEMKSFDGFSTFTNTSTRREDKLPVAKEALVFMAVGNDFKIPIAYFFLDGLQAIDRAILTQEVIRAVETTGAIVVSLTGDGLAANISVTKILGADFESNKPFMNSPSDASKKIYVIWDPPHMLKLLRKYFATQQLFYKDHKLRWDLLVKLAQKQDSDNFNLGNKLSKRHIDWKQSPMTVRLAAETFSNSVADALEQLCEDNYEEFAGCEPTTEFIRLTNNTFDGLNYGGSKKTNEHYKQPLCASTINKFRKLFGEFKEFVMHITVDELAGPKNNKRLIRKPILKSRSCVGFFGLLHTITSAISIYEDYVENGSLDTFYTFQFSQDHLETFFSLVRSCSGANNNPNIQQFQTAYRKLLICMPHSFSRGTNCIPNSTQLLTVSSAQQPVRSLNEDFMRAEGIELDFPYEELISIDEMDPYDQNLCAYLASVIEAKVVRNILTQSRSTCQDCLSVFNENAKIFNSLVAKKNRTESCAQPCSSTMNIVVACNKILLHLESYEYVEYNSAAKTLFNGLDIDELYCSSEFNTHEIDDTKVHFLPHKEQFVSNIIQEYMHMKSRKIGNKITTEEHRGNFIRKKLTRNVINAGQ